jgi:putative transposase
LAEARSRMACHAATSFSQATNDPIIREFGKPIAGSLSTIIGSYKSAVSREVNDRKLQRSRMHWQSKFWDHIIRNDDDLERCRSYIRANPARWDKDQLHPSASPNQFNKEWHAL